MHSHISKWFILIKSCPSVWWVPRPYLCHAASLGSTFGILMPRPPQAAEMADAPIDDAESSAPELADPEMSSVDTNNRFLYRVKLCEACRPLLHRSSARQVGNS
jgi:hypothetical protein